MVVLVSCGKTELPKPKPKANNNQINLTAAPADSTWNWPDSNTTICYYPSSANPIILFYDFDGHYVASPFWNSGRPFYANEAGIADSNVIIVINKIKDYYAPFNVIVTNDETIFDNGTEGRRQRIIVTQTYSWNGNNNGGIAYIGTVGGANNGFTSTEVPSFVFTPLLNYNINDIAAIGAHEAGHAFGLNHQAQYDTTCKLISVYSPGDGIVAPIMGAPNGRIGKWWVGPTQYSCTIIQNDSLIIHNNSQ